MRQCADFSVKSQISRNYWVENSISEEQNYYSTQKYNFEFTAN